MQLDLERPRRAKYDRLAKHSPYDRNNLENFMGKRDKSARAGPSSAASQILPSLFLGPCSSASSSAFLNTNAVTHVLSVGASPAKPVDDVIYHRLSISDSEESSITKVCDAACEIIDGALTSHKGKGKILVHCSAGISRSPMIVSAYLMRRRGMSLKEALTQIVQVRPQVLPNRGFVLQLKEMEMQLRGEESLEVDELPKREKERLALFAPTPESEQSCDGPADGGSNAR